MRGKVRESAAGGFTVTCRLGSTGVTHASHSRIFSNAIVTSKRHARCYYQGYEGRLQV
jgi:hypothetical protein